MCDCIKKLTDNIIADSDYENSVVYIDVQQMESFQKNNLVERVVKTSSTITVGRRFMDSAKIKKQKFSLVHIYCPFCGVKYEN